MIECAVHLADLPCRSASVRLSLEHTIADTDFLADRDSDKFNLGVTESERRRHLFLELYVYDSWMALTLGRPPSIQSAHFDIKPPRFDPMAPDAVATACAHTKTR
jgi:hypothetical protein